MNFYAFKGILAYLQNLLLTINNCFDFCYYPVKKLLKAHHILESCCLPSAYFNPVTTL
jgi:hypothetical protein